MKATFFASPPRFRAWLERNHAKSAEVLVGFHRAGTARGGLTYAQALDQALCYGWIDGIRRRLDKGSFTVRFTPRRRGSRWSRVNVAKVRALVKAGLMRPAGFAAFKARGPANREGYSYERRPKRLPAPLAGKLRAHAKAWAFFRAQAPWYRRTAAFWVVSAKREETRRKRMETLIDDSAHSRLIGPIGRWGRRPRPTGRVGT